MQPPKQNVWNAISLSLLLEGPLHPIIKNNFHIGVQVANLADAIEGEEIHLGPYEPITGCKIVVINDGGLPVEFIEADLADEEIWRRAESQKDQNVDGLK